MTVNSNTLTFLLILGFWSVVTEGLQITATNTNQDGSFSENSKVVLTCTINPYTGSQTWKVDSVAVSDCGIAGCLANSSNPASFSFTNDLVNGIFAFSIDKINSFYHRSQVECFDGSGSDTYTIIVIGPIVITCSQSDGALRLYLKYIIGLCIMSIISVNYTTCGLKHCKSFLEGKNNKIQRMLKDHLRAYLFGAFIYDCIRTYTAKTKFPICNKHEWEWICLECKSYLCKNCDMAINVGKHATESVNEDAKKEINDNQKKDEDKCQRCNQVKIEFFCKEQNCRLKLCISCNDVHRCAHKKKMRIREDQSHKFGKLNTCLILVCCISGFSFFIVFFWALLNRTKCSKQPGSFKCIVLIFSVVCLHPLILLQFVFVECDEDLAQIWWHFLIPIIVCIIVLPFPLICVLSQIMLSQGFHCDDCRLKSKVFGYCTGCFKYLCRDCLHRNHKQPGHLVLQHNDELGKDHEIKSYCFECKEYIRDLTKHIGHPYLATKDDDSLIYCNKKAEYRSRKGNNESCRHTDKFINSVKMNICIRRLELSSDENTKKIQDQCSSDKLCILCSDVINFLIPDMFLFDLIGEKDVKAESNDCEICKENASFFCTYCKTRTCSACIDRHQNHDVCVILDAKKVAGEENSQVKRCKACQAKKNFCFTCRKFVRMRSLQKHDGHIIHMALKPDNDTRNEQSYTSCKAEVIHYCCSCNLFVDAQCVEDHDDHTLLVAFGPATVAENNQTIHCKTCNAHVVHFCSKCNKEVNWTSVSDHNNHKDHTIYMALKEGNEHNNKPSDTVCNAKVTHYCRQCKEFINEDANCQNSHTILTVFDPESENNQVFHCETCKEKVIHFCLTCNQQVDAKTANVHKDHNILTALKPDKKPREKQSHTSCNAKVIHFCSTCNKFVYAKSADDHEGHEIIVAFVQETENNQTIHCTTCNASVKHLCLTCDEEVNWRSVIDHNKHKGHLILMAVKEDNDTTKKQSPTSCKAKIRPYCRTCKTFLDSGCKDQHGHHDILKVFEPKTCAEDNQLIHCTMCNAMVIQFCFTCNKPVNATSEMNHKDHDILSALKPDNSSGSYGNLSPCKTKVKRYCLKCKQPKEPRCADGQINHTLIMACALDGETRNQEGVSCDVCRVNLRRLCLTCNERVCSRCPDKHQKHTLEMLLQPKYGNFIARNDPFECKCKSNHVECLSAAGDKFLCAGCFKNSDKTVRTKEKCVVCKDINTDDATVFCLFCDHYMCRLCFEWHQDLDTNWDRRDKYFISTKTAAQREQILSKYDFFKIILASFPVIGLFAVLAIGWKRGSEVNPDYHLAGSDNQDAVQLQHTDKV